MYTGIKQMKQTYSNQEESKLAAVLQFFCRSEIKKKKKKKIQIRKEKNAPPWTLFSRPKSSGDQDSNQLVQIFGILFYPLPNNNKVNICTTSRRQSGDNEAINKTNQ